MFWEAAVCRPIVVEKNRTDGLTDTEIYAATRINMRISRIHKRSFPHPRPMRKHWIKLLKAIGETCPEFVPKISKPKLSFFLVGFYLMYEYKYVFDMQTKKFPHLEPIQTTMLYRFSIHLLFWLDF